MEKPFTAYRGEQPYVFVCYAHEDAAIVYPQLQWLRDLGANIWYDEGIPAGSNWRATIGGALEGASQVLFYVSNASVKSEHCDREINFALDENKNVVPVLLDDARLPTDLRVGLSRVQMIHSSELSEDAYHNTLAEALGLKLAATRDGPTPRTQAPERHPARAWLGAIGGTILAALLFWAYDAYRETPPVTDIVRESPLKPSIAVLPFVNMSSDPEQEYFSDGISEELLNLLAKNPKLKVISRSSAFSFKGKDFDIPTVAEKLGVANVLEGSVRKSGDTVRITVQLIDAASDAHLWSETYDRELDDVFAIQDEIARRVVEQLNATLLGETSRDQKVDTEAYTLLLQARHLLNQFNFDNLPRAQALLLQALEIDPNYVRAWTELSRVYVGLMNANEMTLAEALPLSRQANERALAIDPDDGLAHSQLGWLAMIYDNDRAAAARWFQRALDLEPTNLIIINNATNLSLNLGRVADAIALGEYLVARDPLCAACFNQLSWAYLFAGVLDEAETNVRMALMINPEGINANWVLGHTLMLNGEPQAGHNAYQLSDPGVFRTYGEALCLHGMGREQEFEVKFAELRERWGNDFPTLVSRVYAWTGEIETAFDWLARYAEPETGPFIAGYWEFLDLPWRPLHGDPRWQVHLEKIGASPDQLAAIDFEFTVPD